MLKKYCFNYRRIWVIVLILALMFSNMPLSNFRVYAENTDSLLESDSEASMEALKSVTGPAISVVSGSVREAGTNTAISGAAISVSGYESFYSSSTYDGSYSIDGVTRDQDYFITVAYEGYGTVTKSLVFDASNDFLLKRIDLDLKFDDTEPRITFNPEDPIYTNIASGGMGTGSITYEITEGDELAHIDPTIGEITILKPGNITVKATREEDDSYCSSTAYYTLLVEKALLTDFRFDIETPSNMTYIEGGSFSNIASSGKSLGTVSYSINNGDAAVIDEKTGELSLLKSGTVEIKATIEEDEIYQASSAYYSITIEQGVQNELVFEDLSPSNISFSEGGTYTNTAIGGSGAGEIVYEILEGGDTAWIEYDTGKLHLIKAGRVTVKGKKLSDDKYQEASTEYTIRIDKANQTGFGFEISNPSDIGVFSYKFVNRAQGGQSSGSISYRIVKGSGATIDKDTGDLHLLWTGTVEVEATKIGDDRYDDVTARYSVTIIKSKQNQFRFEITNPANLSYTQDLTYTNKVTGKLSQNNTVYEILSGEDVADIDSQTGRLTIKKAGAVEVRAIAEGDEKSETASATYTITIVKGKQTGFGFASDIPNQLTYDPVERFMITTLGGQSKGSVSYQLVEGLEVASIDEASGELTLIKAGRIVIQATRASDECYEAIIASKVIDIKKANQTGFEFEFMNPASITYHAEDNVYINTASGGQTGLAISYELINGDAVTLDIETGELMILKAGEVTIQSNLLGDDCYLPAFVTYTLTIHKANQTDFQFDVLEPEHVIYNDNGNEYVNVAQGGQSEKEVTYRIVEGNAATVNPISGKLTILKAGKVVVMGTLSGDDRYHHASTSYELTIEKDEQAIVFEHEGTETEPINLYYGNYFTNTAKEIEDIAAADKYGYGTGEIQYSIASDPEGVIESIGEDGEIVFSNSRIGDVVISATKLEDDCYNNAKEQYYLSVKYLEVPDEPYTLLGETKNTGGWYTSNVTIVAKEGYELSYSNKLTNNIWAGSLLVEEEGPNDKTVYLKRKSSNGYDITDAIEIEEEDIQIDKKAPLSLEVSYSQSVQDIILETITFGIYRSNVKVTLLSEDEVSGIEKFEWKYIQQEGSSNINAAAISKGIIKADEIKYDDNKATASFVLTADEAQQYRGSLYFVATDAAGWSIEKYDEKVVIVDSIAPAVNIQYRGTFVRKINSKNETVNSGDQDIRLIYNSNIEMILEVVEANFFDEQKDGIKDVKIQITKDDVPFNDYRISDWSPNIGSDKYQRTITLEQDGNYVINIEYTDKSGNEMQYTAADKNTSGVYNYQSHVITKDTIAPTVKITFDYSNEDGSKYFNRVRTATLEVIEKNLHVGDITTMITSTNMLNEATDIAQTGMLQNNNWEQISEDIWRSTINFDKDGIYNISVQCKDLADNPSNNHLEESFVIDLSKPDSALFNISYDVPITERILENITLGFYNPIITVSLEATDEISGINHFVWSYDQEKGTSTTKNVNREEAIITTDKISYYDKDTRALASFTLTADEIRQYRGNLSFQAIDNAGNKSEPFADTKIIVVDSIAPVRMAELSQAQQVVDSSSLLTINEYDYKSENTNSVLYYKDNAVLTLQIEEANFMTDDIELLVNDKIVIPEQWVQNGDEWTNQLMFSDDGDYIVTMNYLDASGNQMMMYQSEKIVVDNISPIINVVYSQDTVMNEQSGRKYYDEEQTVTISITEHNFRADDLEVVIVAEDIQGNAVDTIDYVGYLKDRSNWTREGDVYTATIRFDKDANYTFDVSYKDLALNEAASYETDLFTVDTTEPTNLSIDFSQNVYETIWNTITFGYYKENMTVTISAEDNTSGIESFNYSYIKGEGVSGVNAELLEAVINSAEITYSDNGRKAVATFSIPDQQLTNKNQFNGTVMFMATDRSNNSFVTDRPDRIVVDNIAPTATITYNKPINSTNDISYYSGEIEATITITEANFNYEELIVYITKDGEATNKMIPDWSSNNVNVHNGVLRLVEDGDYQITVEYTDRSGNEMVKYQSNQLTIDTVLPVIQVDQIAHEVAYNDEEIGFSISAQDINIDLQSFEPKLECVVMEDKGNFIRQELEWPKINTITTNEKYSYVIDNLELDGVYSLNCSVKDKSGNTASTMIINNSNNKDIDNLNFSVNRQGSTYSLDKVTHSLVTSYFIQNVDNDIILEEVNVDPLETHQIVLNNNILTEGTDYDVKSEKVDGGWHKYSYYVSESLFDTEGEYNLILYSKDKAKNEGYSDIRNAEISFVIDRTAPIVSTSGMEQGGRYQIDSQKVTLIPRDDGGKLNSITVVVSNKDGNPIKDEAGNDISERVNLVGEELLQTLDNNGNKIDFEIPKGLDVNVLVTCADSAFNKEGYSNLSVIEVNNITVSPDWYIIFYANKPLFYGTIAGVAAAIALLIGSITLIKRKRKNLIE